MNQIIPNVFLIGVQKAATTSLYDWIAQHPEVCGPVSMKDTPFFIDDELYQKGLGFLHKVYKRHYNNEKIIINGCANNIYFEKALARIASLNKSGKIIVVLRNPIERAFSAYQFAKKRNMEKASFCEAIKMEKDRLKDPNLKTIANLTYVDHGFYFKQLTTLLKYFPKENIKVLLYEDIKYKPMSLVKEIYDFISIDVEFTPNLKKLNKTGEPRFGVIKKLIYNDSKFKKYFLKYFFDKVVSHDRKYRLKLFFLNLITKKPKISDPKISDQTKNSLLNIFMNDIESLEKLLELDLSEWKNHNQ